MVAPSTLERPVASAMNVTWRPLYRVGGMAAALAVALYLLALVAVSVGDPLLTGGGVAMLEYVGGHRTMYAARQVLWLAPCLPLMAVFLALVVTQRRQRAAFVPLAGVLAVSSWALSFAKTAGCSLLERNRRS